MHSIFTFYNYMVYFNTSTSKIASITYNLFHVLSTCNMIWLPTFEHLFMLSGFLGDSDGKESACNARDPSSIPGLGRSPGEGNGNPLQYSCLGTWTEEPDRLYNPWGHKRIGQD